MAACQAEPEKSSVAGLAASGVRLEPAGGSPTRSANRYMPLMVPKRTRSASSGSAGRAGIG